MEQFEGILQCKTRLGSNRRTTDNILNPRADIIQDNRRGNIKAL